MAQRFVHRASAVPFGGAITRPFSDVLDAQAATSLSPDGGAGAARAEAFRYREIVSFDAAYSQVAGSRDDAGSNETIVLAVVEGLNILDMVTADRVVARLTSSQKKDASATDELPMRLAGSYFVNLRIAGAPVDLPLRPDVLTKTTKSKLTPEGPADGHTVISAFEDESLAPLSGCGRVDGRTVEIPDFGAVTLGELIVSAKARRLTMVRVELGSPIGGWMTAGVVEGNGSPY